MMITNISNLIIRFIKEIGKYNEKNCFNLLKAFANSIQIDAILLRIVTIFYFKKLFVLKSESNGCNGFFNTFFY